MAAIAVSGQCNHGLERVEGLRSCRGEVERGAFLERRVYPVGFDCVVYNGLAGTCRELQDRRGWHRMEQAIEENTAGEIANDRIRDTIDSVVYLFEPAGDGLEHHMNDRVHLQRRCGETRPETAGVVEQSVKDLLLGEILSPLSLEMALDSNPPTAISLT